MSSKNPQIFVTRLPRDFNEEDLRKTFRKFGKIKEATLKRGYGFVVSIVPIVYASDWKPRECNSSASNLAADKRTVSDFEGIRRLS
jgi:RNA recognition motif-containing protein